jgi:hypothetical protein
VLPATELFSLMNAEFMRDRSEFCHRCTAPPPIRIRTAGRWKVNWRLPRARACAHGCAAIIAAIAMRFEKLYLLPTE